MKKKALSLPLILLLLPLTYLSFAPAEAVDPGVYIHSDGSVEGTSSIQRNGDTYTFTSNFTGPLYVEKNNIVIDGAGYSVNNGSVRGVVLANRFGVTLKNTVVELSGGYVVDLERASGCSLINNTLAGLPTIVNIPGLPPTPSLGPYAVNLLNSQGITIKDNYITGFVVALSLEWSSNHVITGNTITGGITGIDIIDSPGCTFRNNNLTNCRLSVRMYPSYHYDNDFDASNTLDGKPIYYWLNAKDQTVPSDAGYIVLVNCRNIQVSNCNPEAICLVATTNTQISNVQLVGWKSDGITLQNCSSITLSDCSLRDLNIAITLSYSSSNIIRDNTFRNSSNCIMLDNANNNLILGNGFDGCGYGVSGFQDTPSIGNTFRSNNFTGSNIALNLRGNSTVDANRFVNNEYGVYFWSTSGSTITQNTFTNNTNALYIHGSSDNKIYLNNFLNNDHQVTDAGTVASAMANIHPNGVVQTLSYNLNPLNFLPPPPPSHNQYDNGVKGNYWVNYNGSDANGDGIGDTPYLLYEGNVDHFPLMNQVEPVVAPEPTPTPNPSAATAQPSASSNTQPNTTSNPALPEMPLSFAVLLIGLVAAATALLAAYRKSSRLPKTCKCPG